MREASFNLSVIASVMRRILSVTVPVSPALVGMPVLQYVFLITLICDFLK